MSKRKSTARLDSINLPRRLREGLEEADNLLSKNEPQNALALLEELDEKFPRQPDVLALIANAELDLKDQHGYLQAMYRLHSLSPNRADVKLGLAGAYLANGYLALALRTFREFIKHWSRDERSVDVQKTVSMLEPSLSGMLGQLDFTLATGLEFACNHEELQVLMEQGNYERCKQLAKSLLEQRPHFVPVLNNLSQVEWLMGSLTEAIGISRKALDIEPDNVHALSNLTRFLFMQGQTDESGAFARRLKESQAEAADRWTKKAEALSFIGDDEGVLALLEQTKHAKEQDELNEMTWHWYAVAEYRVGNNAQARAYWQKCLKLAPSFSIAKDNLEELKKPVHERTLPQAFSLDTWLPRRIFVNLLSAVEGAVGQKNDAALRDKIRVYLDEHAEILRFVPAALADGDSQCREFALQLADMSAHPAILDSLKVFSLGERGPDALRLEAAQILSRHGIFKSGKMVDLWLEGERKPIMMLGFQISYNAPEKPYLRPAAQRLMEQAIYALRDGDGAKAEIPLRKALEIQKDDPGLFNNLAVALSLQGRQDEAEAIANELPVRFPDYFFGQVITVRKAIQAKHLEKARSLLDKMMQKKELHVSEFGALCACQIDYLMEDHQPEGALSWFEMWEQGYPDDPHLEDYEEIMNEIHVFSKLKNRLPRGRRKTWAPTPPRKKSR